MLAVFVLAGCLGTSSSATDTCNSILTQYVATVNIGDTFSTKECVAPGTALLENASGFANVTEPQVSSVVSIDCKNTGNWLNPWELTVNVTPCDAGTYIGCRLSANASSSSSGTNAECITEDQSGRPPPPCTTGNCTVREM